MQHNKKCVHKRFNVKEDNAMKATEPVRCKREVAALANYYKDLKQIRNYVLIALSIYTALRICDILRIQWCDVYDFQNERFFNTIRITEKKTKKTKVIALNQAVIKALKLFIKSAKPERYLIENTRTSKAICREQAYRIIRAAAEALKLQQRVSCHSLRKTFGYHAWKSGVSPAIIMEIYNHSSLAVTRRYLGVTQDDINSVYLGLSFDVVSKRFI